MKIDSLTLNILVDIIPPFQLTPLFVKVAQLVRALVS